MSKPYPTKEARARLTDRIILQLAEAPATINTLADALGFSGYAIRQRLNLLLEEKRAYFVEIITADGLGIAYEWHLGERPKHIEHKPLQRATTYKTRPDEQDDLPPKQIIVRAFPSVSRRDPLVAALFGSAHKEAA